MTLRSLPDILRDPLGLEAQAELLRGLRQAQQGLLGAIAALGQAPVSAGAAPGLIDPAQFILQTYPAAGGRRAMPSGQAVVDLKAGKITRRDSAGGESLSTSLSQYGFAFAMSGMIWVDSELTAQLSAEGVNTGQLYLPQSAFFQFGPMPVDTIVLDSPLPYELMLLFSTLTQAPVDFDARTMDQERFADITTVDAFTPVPFTPTGGANLAAAFHEAELITRGIGAKFFIVDNYGSNSINANIQFQEADGETWLGFGQWPTR